MSAIHLPSAFGRVPVRREGAYVPAECACDVLALSSQVKQTIMRGTSSLIMRDQ